MTTSGQESPYAEEIREIWKLFRETDQRFKETQRELRELKERFKDTDERFRKAETLVSNLAGKWGRFVEGIVAPGAIRMFRERGI